MNFRNRLFNSNGDVCLKDEYQQFCSEWIRWKCDHCGIWLFTCCKQMSGFCFLQAVVVVAKCCQFNCVVNERILGSFAAIMCTDNDNNSLEHNISALPHHIFFLFVWFLFESRPFLRIRITAVRRGVIWMSFFAVECKQWNVDGNSDKIDHIDTFDCVMICLRCARHSFHVHLKEYIIPTSLMDLVFLFAFTQAIWGH